MYQTFENLDEGKKEKIINAALDEFVQRGYDKASTNEIVKNAEISKGLLFHYFKNKKKLYLYLYDFCLNTVKHEFYQKIDFEETNFISMLRKIQSLKLELHKRHPQLFKFMIEAYMEQENEIREAIVQQNMVLTKYNMAKLFQNIDTSGFRKGIGLNEVLSIITWTFEGIVNDELKRCKAMNVPIDYLRLYQLAESYLNSFEKLIYEGGC